MTKEKETENRSERERFLDRMLKEILSGQRKPGDRLPTESELAAPASSAWNASPPPSRSALFPVNEQRDTLAEIPWISPVLFVSVR